MGLEGSEREKRLGRWWKALPHAAETAKWKAPLVSIFTGGQGGTRAWAPTTLAPEVTEATLQDIMADKEAMSELNGLLGSVPAETAEPEQVVSYGAQDAVDYSTRRTRRRTQSG